MLITEIQSECHSAKIFIPKRGVSKVESETVWRFEVHGKLGSAYSKDPRLCIVECSQYPGDSCPVSAVSQTEHLLVLAPLGVFVPELAVDQKR